MRLTDDDFQRLEECYVSRDMATAAGITRVDSIDGRDRMGRSGAGEFSGWLIPNIWPGTSSVIAERLRLDHPPIDAATHRPQHKYLSPPGQRNRLYFAPGTEPAWLSDISMTVYLCEGEKKALALARAALEAAVAANGNGAAPRPLFLPIALSGVWSWRGVVGIATDANGRRVQEKGVIPDIDRVAWRGRRVVIGFDANASTNESVRAARAALARELESRGALVFILELPPQPGVNGPDDFLAQVGLRPFLHLFEHALRYDWHDELAHTDKGKILKSFSNALTALRLAPEWRGVLGFNEFALRVEARKPPPFHGITDFIGPWSDDCDFRALEWLEHNGIPVGRHQASEAIQTVAHEQPFHPVREYLDALKWDGAGRLDDWLTLYLGADPNDYIRAVGARWMISGVARIENPGCKADHTLVLEGAQGGGKSTAFSILGGEFYTDNVGDLTTKDAAMSIMGRWICELPELDSMSRAEVSRVKAFLSCATDHLRPPYGLHYIDAPRQSIFGGSINLSTNYLRDETGGRRFWPVRCGSEIRLTALARDRDQLWAEAVVRYRKGEPWWLDAAELVEEAADEQEKRFLPDAWEPLVATWLLGQAEATVTRALIEAIKKEPGQFTKGDEVRVGVILHRLGWVVIRRPRQPGGGVRPRIYGPKPE